MKVEELRIGNLLKYPKYHKDGTDKIWKVRDLFTDNFSIGLSDGIVQTKVSFDSMLPIPLTEEWLKKFGYETIGVDFFEDETRLSLWKSKHNFDGFIADWEDKTVRSISYVHELQNLYFALTGEELTLKQ